MKQEWDEFWSTKGKRKGLFSRFLSFYRIQIVARSVNYNLNKFFAPEGVFVECGAGTSETTSKTNKNGRKFIALDYSALILRRTKANPKIDSCVNGDIFTLPFADASLDGIWNVGVMEHYTLEDIYKILKEFRRVLKSLKN